MRPPTLMIHVRLGRIEHQTLLDISQTIKSMTQEHYESARVRIIAPKRMHADGRCVVYWMQRSQRGRDNAALNLAVDMANRYRVPVVCCFGLFDQFPGAERRHFRFLVQGLVDASADLARKNIPLIVRLGQPPEVVAQLAGELNPIAVVTDDNPLKIGQFWRNQLASDLKVPLYVVDSDVVVPSSHFPKEEYAARTIRPKIHKVLASYLHAVPNPVAIYEWPPDSLPGGERIDENLMMEQLRVGGASETPDYRGGSKEAQRRLDRFIRERLETYAGDRNEPVPYKTSELSAHLHFGHIDPIHVVLSVIRSGGPQESVDSFVEEFVVRRELAINYCLRNPQYDTLGGCPDWARKTLAKHAGDARPYLYTYDQFERAETHDPLWNAAQLEMVHTGRMHNYLRMYWAKKILEWTPDAESAFGIAIALNDRWEMDGRDPNGYTGVAWAIGGKHDRPWIERPIFGMVRFMSYASTHKKFDSAGYIDWVNKIASGCIKSD